MRFRFVAALLVLFLVKVAYGQTIFEAVGVGCPHIVVGGDTNATNYDTILQLVNNNSASTTAHMTLYGDSGSPLAVSFDGQTPQSTADITLKSGETRQILLTLSTGRFKHRFRSWSGRNSRFD